MRRHFCIDGMAEAGEEERGVSEVTVVAPV